VDKTCSNCGKTIAEVGELTRVNRKGVPGVWSCPYCLAFTDNEIESCDGKAIHVHTMDCPGFCDFACNGDWGKQLAEWVNICAEEDKKESQGD